MQRDQAADFVAGILTRNEVPFLTGNDGQLHQVQVGSSAVLINFAGWDGDADTVVNLRAIVLERLPANDEDSQRFIQSLEAINDLNVSLYFSKFCRTADSIVIEHDLLASKMQADELMNALNVVATIADEWDDRLKEKLGGKTWAEVDAEGTPGEAVDV